MSQSWQPFSLVTPSKGIPVEVETKSGHVARATYLGRRDWSFEVSTESEPVVGWRYSN